MKQFFFLAAMLVQSTVAGAADLGTNEPHPFEQPSTAYLQKFARPGEKTFVYERYDARGDLLQREVTPLTKPVQINSATERVINGVIYRLRGLAACPKPKITYKAEKWDCTKAAQDYDDAVYNTRASVVLCKTLVLKSQPGIPDAVSCFALVGAGNGNDPYSVSYDDDSMVFFDMATIGRNKDGKSLRPDLEHASDLGKQFQSDEAN
ncbi:hypothetical protein EOA46_29455 [Mesorhizobium sp. M1A.F.Ca.IN.022.05.2.1]|nr:MULTISPECIES: hypothetical protein [unclassified Mesorhizobium]RUV81041.1 hypothetical protein EOA51_32120 [Mesorhizobium sp. M1A.F.Ca.IN.020.32.1.1]RUW05075.1 hypothetical protein EOA46_29455 [Mesorhizobium sp. M1A.F.Ca.IN.022.05.2.1]RWG07072.1 MAG: hypothetical protein EOQ38_00395 [Mesorhizobium sp.]RWG92675.1 MAG: hypothetical protein EOQ68_01235 [Mesorhizobium sp.]RWH07837.1 MAG: hypothetical protein EOQ73_00390 [Mesorhizobium sp.]